MSRSLIYITGPDGSGKTSFIKELEEKLNAANKEVRHVWIRSPKLTSKPLMLLCRVFGLTEYKTRDGIEFGRHDFHKSKLVSSVFPYLQLIDFKLVWWYEKLKIPKKAVVIFDRFSLDTLCDLMVSTRNFRLHESWVGRRFIEMVPELKQVVLLSVSEGRIRERKADTRYDELLGHKIKAFAILGKDLDLKSVDNNGSFSETKSTITNYFLND